MRILYAIQGTGNGHLTRALDTIPALQQRGEVDIVVSGIQVDLSLPYPVKYRLKGLGFVFGKNGGVDFYRTFAKASSRSFYNDTCQLPVNEYDLVITDFEPVTAWACMRAKKHCVGLSNQVAVLNQNVPKPKETDHMGKFILKNYAPTTAQYGFHFARFDDTIFTPIIRKQVRELEVSNQGHYTVYLPAHDDHKIVNKLSRFKNVEWQVFSKHNKQPFQHENISVQPIQNDAFLQSMASSAGVLCAAGFGTPSEVLYLQKKLLVVPMKNQYEQVCNAAALKHMGVATVKSLKKKHLPKISEWQEHGEPIQVHYPDETDAIVARIVQENT
ncbi:glycosyltransferase family protein [Pontibacter cellulosilyticus]|uniref:Glycosyl transferase n=1 Tax=Pontibacter cellulosilyticus TaxID=1720253 RepID=A0A923N5P2_9BACT|nr:glycosyltransferase family protein [Pontibacter cellulosilyticus]MBC5992217.1 glycosyl transferase [Pontibacter cellulosilyticus]